MFYCIIPFISALANNKNYCLYVILILFGVNLLISPDGYSKLAIICYVLYGLIGYYIHTWGAVKFKILKILYVLAIFGLIAQIVGTTYLSASSGQINYYFKSYTHITCIFYSIGLFVFIKYDLIKIMEYDLINKLVSFLDFYTFGIYLIHWYILKFLVKFFNINITSIYWKLFASILIIIISVAIIYLIRKIPFVKKIVP